MDGFAGVGLWVAFLGGMVSFLSPCVLPLAPGYVSFVAGRAVADERGGAVRALGLGLCFVLGFSTVFILLGAGASALGGLLLRWKAELSIAGGALIVVFGLAMIGLPLLPAMTREARFAPDIVGGRPLGAYGLGLAFGFGWTPCIGPVLGAILTLAASGPDLAEGVALLAVYAAGLGAPFLLVAVFADRLAGRLRGLGRAGWRLHQAAGAVMVVMGVAMATGRLSDVAFWLLETFPALGRIG
jgi:cytochrome c-type biogenesis protein